MELARDAIIFGLRMNEGVCVESVTSQFNLERALFEDVVIFLDLLVNENLAERRGQHYSLNRDGRIRCDAIATEMPELLARSI